MKWSIFTNMDKNEERDTVGLSAYRIWQTKQNSAASCNKETIIIQRHIKKTQEIYKEKSQLPGRWNFPTILFNICEASAGTVSSFHHLQSPKVTSRNQCEELTLWPQLMLTKSCSLSMTWDFHTVHSCQGWLELLDCILSSFIREKTAPHFFLPSSSKTFIPLQL